MKCRKCNQDAVIFQRYSGSHLCRRHFSEDFEARAKKTVRTHGWIEPDDIIAVALSGGKDSSALLHFLTTVFEGRRDLSIIAITVDEGIEGYRDTSVAKKIAARYGVEWHSVSFAREAGTTMDSVVIRKGDQRSCSYCGVIRRCLLNRTALSLGATKIALGFNLDDDAQSVMMNVLRGDAARLCRKIRPIPGIVPRIRPFQAIPEREVALYAHLHVGDFDEAGCPYAHNALRADVRGMLNDYGYRHPATKFALLRLGEELSSMDGTGEEGMSLCPVCGEPYEGGECGTCRILAEVREE